MRTETKTMRKLTLLVAAMALAVLLAAIPAHAATTFTVNTINDASDAETTDGVCASAAGQCTLRAAIEQANALAGDDVIEFAPSLSGTIVLGGHNNSLSISSNLKINGPGSSVLSVSADDPAIPYDYKRVFSIGEGATAAINGLTITGGFSNQGSGISNAGTLMVSDSTITGNTTSRDMSPLVGGGGIYNLGSLTVQRSTISGNTAYNVGGGIYSKTQPLPEDRTGTLQDLVSSYYAIDGDTLTTKTTIINSTISGNTAQNQASNFSGGGVYNHQGLTEIVHSTITNNSGADSGVLNQGNFHTRTDVSSSIIAGNANTDVAYHPDIASNGSLEWNSFNSLGYNLVGDGNGTNQSYPFNKSGDIRGVADPGLEALSLNGGSTKTHALKATSPALNQGPPDSACAETDQRGVNRPQEGTCDIGSFERDTTPPDAPVITSPAEGSLNPGSFTISGTAEAGAKVELFEGTVSKDEARANSSGAWSIDLTGVTPDGKHSYTAKATDVGGNVSGASGTRTVRVDATAPAAPLIDSPAEGSLNPSSFSVTGRAEANSTVELFEGTTSIGTDTSDEVGAWSIALSGVSDGSHSYTAKAIDSVGNTSAASRARSITVDAKAPLAPVITYPAQGTRLNYRSFSLSGTAEAGAKVELFEGALSKGTATADTYGKWKIALSGVSEGSHSYTAKATDASGNTSAPSSIRTVIVDTTKPKATSVDPAENATAVVPDANIYVTFSEAMKATTINTTTFKLFKEGSTTAITASVSYDPISKKATLNPYPYSHERLEPEVTYKAVVTTGAKDLAGNALDQNPTLTGNQNKVWFFKVVFDPTDQ